MLNPAIKPVATCFREWGVELPFPPERGPTVNLLRRGGASHLSSSSLFEPVSGARRPSACRTGAAHPPATPQRYASGGMILRLVVAPAYRAVRLGLSASVAGGWFLLDGAAAVVVGAVVADEPFGAP